MDNQAVKVLRVTSHRPHFPDNAIRFDLIARARGNQYSVFTTCRLTGEGGIHDEVRMANAIDALQLYLAADLLGETVGPGVPPSPAIKALVRSPEFGPVIDVLIELDRGPIVSHVLGNPSRAHLLWADLT